MEILGLGPSSASRVIQEGHGARFTFASLVEHLDLLASINCPLC